MVDKIHFETLWEESENLFKGQEDSAQTIITELSAKLAIYSSIDKSDIIPKEDKHKMKINCMGKILSSLTHLSLVDDVNTFAALHQSIIDLKSEKL